MTIKQFKCSVCGRSYSPEQVSYVCPEDGGNLDTLLDFSGVTQEQVLGNTETSVWRYAPLLPVSDPGFQRTPLHQVGMTPVYQPETLARDLGLPQLYIKMRAVTPAHPLKDRASAVVVAKALAAGEKRVVAASTGNAGAAMACMSAAVGLPAIILAPRTAPPAKVAQLLTFGAQVILVDGNYDAAFDLSIEASKKFGWYNRNTGYNPFTVEGKKTAAFEIWEQVLRHLPASTRPLQVFIPVGDGNILSGLAKGFIDLLELGWIDQLPRLIGIQAEGSAAIANAFLSGSDRIDPVTSTTIADSISVDLPRDGLRALRRVRESGGFFITVTDSEILSAIPQLGKAGLFVEPAAAAAYAGLRKALLNQQIDPNCPTLVLCTGSGLKDIRAAAQAAGSAPVIEPSIKALRKVTYD